MTDPIPQVTLTKARQVMTFHALRRYLERVAGFAEEVAAAEAQVADPTDDRRILNVVLRNIPLTADDLSLHLCTPSVLFAIKLGLRRYKTEDMIYIFKGGCVTTIYGIDDPDAPSIEDTDADADAA